MDMTSESKIGSNHSNRSDSGMFSATNNSSFREEPTNMSGRTSNSESADTDNRSDCSSPDRKYLCPICETMLTSQHEFTLHIRSHNNDSEDKGFTCKICFKELSSSSSLDRHVLVHTGERPFTCKHCGDTFTTNGNMHRHMRTHRAENYESDGSTDSSSSSSKVTEFNNNKVECKDKRKLEQQYKENCKKIKLEDSSNFRCPICERDDFSTMSALEIHLEDNHPDYPAKCQLCNQTFKNNKHLNAHKTVCHAEEATKQRNSVVGFKDLTFVDFSSKKFPHIARIQCEKHLHKPSTGLKFICSKCSRAFPCANSLEFHQDECSAGGLDLSLPRTTTELNRNTKFFESEIKRADFFSRLDLQDSSPEKDEKPKIYPKLLEKALDSSKDFADIQSILSMTSNGSFLQHLQTKNNEVAQNTETNQEPSKSEHEEESQDVFATEFRKMKLRGEFPCRLCTAVFPNLRALKGHNRQHLNGNNNGTYRCNMCPHSSIDKAALIRHMRTHNGDRPYECSLCNYAFTTKANCERHLRNRHSKSTREEVKKSIIYHPSEDPTNDELNKLTSSRDETKKLSLSLNSSDSNDVTPEKLKLPAFPVVVVPEEPRPDIHALLPITKLHALNEQNKSNINEIIHKENIKSLRDHREQLSPYLHKPISFTPQLTNTSTPHKIEPKIQVKSLETLTEIAEESKIYDEDDPMNLVLDLSKKKVEEEAEEEIKVVEDVPQDLTTKSTDVPAAPTMNEILVQQLLKSTPFYASQLALFRNGFNNLPNIPNWPGFPINNPFLFQTMAANPMLSQDPQDFKERLQRMQLCSGGMIIDYPDRLKNFHHQLNQSANQQTKPEDVKPLTLNIETNYPENINKLQPSPMPQIKSEIMQSPNSVKMVIKNGVLMPKQKQRRYRTERPFSCEHCSARFTLRSNMERHIKQQHPQFWCQRQRSNIGTPGRKSQSLQTTLKSSFELNVPSFEVPKMQDFDEMKDRQISEKIKYAILAQHLRASKAIQENRQKKEDDDECDLIIDEKDIKNEHPVNETQFVAPRVENAYEHLGRSRILEEKLRQLHAAKQFVEKSPQKSIAKTEEAQDLVPISRLLDNASQQQFKEFFRREGEDHEGEGVSEEDEEGLVASGSTSEGNSGTDENK